MTVLLGGGILDIKEYILNIRHRTFAIYAESEKEAINTFLKLCNKYSNTDNNEFRDYWLDLEFSIKHEGYQIIENGNFEGVREIL